MSSSYLPYASICCPGGRYRRGTENSGGEPTAGAACCGESLTGAGECLLSHSNPYSGGSCCPFTVLRWMSLSGQSYWVDVPHSQPPATCFHVIISVILATRQGSKCCTHVYIWWIFIEGSYHICMCSVSQWLTLIFLENEKHCWRDEFMNLKKVLMDRTAQKTDE